MLCDLRIIKEKDAAFLDTFSLDLFVCGETEKVRIVWSIFNRRGYFEKYKIEDNTFCAFVHSLRGKYNKRGNPFHNFDHGVSVMHGCHIISQNTHISTILRDINDFSLVFSGKGGKCGMRD